MALAASAFCGAGGASTSGRGAPSAAAAPARRAIHRAPPRRAPPPARRAAAAAAADDDTPEWLRQLEEEAEFDEEVAGLLRGAGGDPETVRGRMRAEMDALHARLAGGAAAGEPAPPEVTFREVDPFDLWIWVEFYVPPAPAEAELLQEVVDAWFLLGRLGAYDAGNLQAAYGPRGGAGLDGLEYEPPAAGALAATMHDAGRVEVEGAGARFWVDMGTADELALDILLNALLALSREHVGLRRVVVGGREEAGWAAPTRAEFAPRVTMDPSSVGGGDGEWRP
jgi:hypothetical protein